MIVPLEWLSELHGVPVVALLTPVIELPDDPVDVPDGASVLRTAPPPAKLMALFPDLPPDDGWTPHDVRVGREKTWQEWSDRFLVASIVEPVLTIDEIREMLGPDRQRLTFALLRAWGVLPEADKAWKRVPSERVRTWLQKLQEHTGRLPHELLDLTLSDLMFDHYVMVGAVSADG